MIFKKIENIFNEQFMNLVEYITTKSEITHFEQFLLLTQCIHKSSAAKAVTPHPYKRIEKVEDKVTTAYMKLL